MAAETASCVWRSAEPGGAALAAALAARRCSTSRADAVGAHQRRVQAGDVGLHHAGRDAGGEQVQRRAAVRSAIAALVRGKRGAGAQVRAHEQRVDHPGRRARIREAFVAARSHPGQREGGAP
jgi:hypothetical protein